MASQYLPSIGDLASWDDPVLLTQAPFQDTFAGWKIHFQGGSATRAERTKLTDQLVAELVSAGIQSKLQHWVNLAFNPPGSKRTQTADSRALRFFVEVQWALFDGGHKIYEMLAKECHQRDAKFVSTSTLVEPAAPLKVSTGGAKRKAQTMQHKETERRPKPDSSKKLRAPAPKPTTALPRADPRVPTARGIERQSAHTQTRGVHTKPIVKPKPKKRRIDSGPIQLKPKGSWTKRHRTGNMAVGAIRRREKRKWLRNKKDPSPKLRKEKPTSSPVSMTRATEGLVAESCGKLCMSSKNCCVDQAQQKAVSPPTPSSDAPILSNDANHNSVPQGPFYPAILPIAEVQHQGDVRSLLPSPLLPGPTAFKPILNWPLTSTEDSGPTEIGLIKIENKQQAIPPLPYPPIVKPPLPDYPPVWAQSRQEVCESFDWFRSYQSGVYHARNVAKGYLLSAFSARRDIFYHGGKLIISHGGGKAQSIHSRQGQYVTQEADDQLAQDKSVRALLATYRSRRPIVLLIDDKYVQFPYDLGLKDITYAVLGFYTIVHAWAEYQPATNERGRVVRYKFAFQWCESQGVPWWLGFGSSDVPEEREPTVQSQDEPECVEQSYAPFEHIEEISMRCPACHDLSAQVYGDSWTCLNPDCPRFWQDISGKPLSDDLQYNPQFLQLAPADALVIPAEKLEPRLPGLSSPGLTTDYAYTRGWHCKDCGRLSCRYKWEHWECMHCKAVFKATQRTRQAMEFLFLTPPVSFKEVFVAKESGIERLVFRVFDPEPHDGSFGQCFTYRLPEGRGFIHHIKTGNPFWNKEADGIFQEYQEQASTGALPFRRWPMRAHKCRGALLTNYFSQNGVPYQYVGGTENTLPFDEVPNAVVRARNLIQTRVKQALGRDEIFNEVLSAAYMERQKMAFHTDDEIGLGPLVAGLSLGSPALMHFRLLLKHTPEGTPRSIAISFVLRHGDVLAMDGEGVQQFYEHTVVPTNFRIAATARYININHLKREKSS